jgi:hypothetical protein
MTKEKFGKILRDGGVQSQTVIDRLWNDTPVFIQQDETGKAERATKETIEQYLVLFPEDKEVDAK